MACALIRPNDGGDPFQAYYLNLRCEALSHVTLCLHWLVAWPAIDKIVKCRSAGVSEDGDGWSAKVQRSETSLGRLMILETMLREHH